MIASTTTSLGFQVDASEVAHAALARRRSKYVLKEMSRFRAGQLGNVVWRKVNTNAEDTRKEPR